MATQPPQEVNPVAGLLTVFLINCCVTNQKPGSLRQTVNYLALSFMGQNPAQLCSPKAVVKAGSHPKAW